jgi:hypothetical protein
MRPLDGWMTPFVYVRRGRRIQSEVHTTSGGRPAAIGWLATLHRIDSRGVRSPAMCCILLSYFLATGIDAAQQKLDQPTLIWIQAVLDNWEAVCRRHLRVPPQPLPWIIFYDENFAWHLNPDVRSLPPHEGSTHPLRFSGRVYPLVGMAHQNGKLWVPGRESLPVNVTGPRIAAMPYEDDRNSFFIAPLPGLFHKLGRPDQARNLDELFLGTAAHELMHTRQLVYAMAQIKRLRLRYKLPESFDDNIIQHEFEANEEYKRLHDEEGELLTKAILADDLHHTRQFVEQFLLATQKRKERFFAGPKQGYSDLEDIFLAMEGLAMWVQYRTARDRASAGEDWLQTFVTLSERADAWSQQDGLALLVLIERLAPGWQTRLLASDFPSPFILLREAVRRRTR